MSLPYRQIHLDFHTSEHIPDVGQDFDPERFARTLLDANVNSVTLFSKCHHGWCYYPTQHGTPHPHLQRPDLLGEMVEACNKVGIATPIYLTIQWDELMARQNPDWKVVSKNTGTNQPVPTWSPVSLANEGLVKHICDLGREIVERYDPPGIFADILIDWEDVSSGALQRMLNHGLNPELREDRVKNDRGIVLEFYKAFAEATKTLSSNLRLFFNSGHIYKNERERYQYFDHLEIESLPTGGWGYDHFPLSARYAPALDKDFLGMTGKFHNWWGDFGGFKQAAALEYECCLMASLGARCSIGDQLHPSGELDTNTYQSIAPAYKRISQLEPYLEEAKQISPIALYSSEGHFSRGPKNADDPHDTGISRMLLETQLTFDVIDEHCDFGAYKLIILPDRITFEEGKLLEKFKAYLEKGGKLLLSGTSGMNKKADRFLLPFPATVEGPSQYEQEYLRVDQTLDSRMPTSPFIAYTHAQQVRSSEAAGLANIHEPYFNRRPEHFCSHQQTPYQLEAAKNRKGILATDNIVYFAHPIGEEYRKFGQPLIKYAFASAIKRLIGDPVVQTNLPSTGRVTLAHQAEHNRFVLHLLYAQPQARGDIINGAHGPTTIEIIEDIAPFPDLEAKIAPPKAPSKVYSAYDQRPIDTHYEDGQLVCKLPKLHIHEAIVIEL
ncbi:beta-galactosidase trimerization domain-containing protein [Pelagicoccus sp. NFK12]|uniref:Beta-galactosidase trimerization domain-containing protein n=1 Tax=Pelagicoccus enzymogenes TaxID=2773457 RepID=A0A927IFF0_9BACT|nr:alpha-amylase family protein [Pelagicoccus enzymogenes]MBD5778036.1 beta-galactosidase trimerization domain-containing protein [Pelagicoccus enzymogenes]